MRRTRSPWCAWASPHVAGADFLPTETGLRGWRCSQLRTSLRTKLPANREINREFRKFRASAAISASNQRANSKPCSQIPYATEQGIFAALTGNFFGITGNLIERAAKALSCCRDVELALAEERVQRTSPAMRRISRGTAPRFLLAFPAQPSNRAARGRAL